MDLREPSPKAKREHGIRNPPGLTPPAGRRLLASPGEFTLRAQWWLWGCTENPEGTDCLAPLQIEKRASWGGTTADVEIQSPVEVLSNEIKVQSPILPDLGTLKLGFEVIALPNPQGWSQSNPLPAKCAGQAGTSVECTVFHYSIRNLGDRPVRNGRFTCSDDSIVPEYRMDGGDWKHSNPGCRSARQMCILKPLSFRARRQRALSRFPIWRRSSTQHRSIPQVSTFSAFVFNQSPALLRRMVPSAL